MRTVSFGCVTTVHERRPRLHRKRTDGKMQLMQDRLVHFLARKHQRHFVNARHVARLEHGILRHVAEKRDLRAHVFVQLVFGAAQQDVRLHADLQERLYGMLGWFGFQFAGRADERHERQMHVQCVRLADLQHELAHRLEERQRFDVADRAANFG